MLDPRRSRSLLAVLRSLPGPGLLPAARARDRLRRLLPRHPDDPRDLDARLRRARRSRSRGVPTSTIFWGIVALVLVYTRVRLRGLPRRASSRCTRARRRRRARSGSPAAQTLRYVILPQAVRRVIPPLLNDFIGLQKDTALVGIARRDRGVQAGADRRERDVQLHAVPRAPRCSSSRSRSRSRASPTG